MLLAVARSAIYHLIHFGLLFGIPAVLLLVLLLFDRRNTVEGSGLGPSQRSRARDAPRARRPHHPYAVAALSAGAGIVHAGVISAHFREYWLFGLFFVAAATAQNTWAIVLLRAPSRLVMTLGALGNTAVVALWTLTRTAGIPIGPEGATREPVGPLDALATGYEVVLVLALMLLLRHPQARAHPLVRSGAIASVLILGAIVFAVFAGNTAV